MRLGPFPGERSKHLTAAVTQMCAGRELPPYELWGLVQSHALSELWLSSSGKQVTIPSLLSCQSHRQGTESMWHKAQCVTDRSTLSPWLPSLQAVPIAQTLKSVGPWSSPQLRSSPTITQNYARSEEWPGAELSHGSHFFRFCFLASDMELWLPSPQAVTRTPWGCSPLLYS